MAQIARHLMVTLAVAFLAFGFSAAASIHFYRYQLFTRCGNNEFRQSLQKPSSKGQYFVVEYDALDRLYRISTVAAGKKIFEEVYHYASDRKLPDNYETFSNGERTGMVKLQFDDRGCIKREDYLTVHNVPADYATNSYMGSTVVSYRFDPKGVEEYRFIFHYNEEGILVRMEKPRCRDNEQSFEAEYNPGTGEEIVRKQFSDGTLQATAKSIYDPDGILIRREIYDKSGLCGTEQYSGNLMVDRAYHFGTNDVVEYRYSYDIKNWINETKVCHNGKYICSLTYERLSNGTAVRTTAKSPDAEIWADYPNTEVTVINRDGGSGATNCVIYKNGPWW